MTLGYRILLSKEVDRDGNSALLAHELVHVRQWAESGRIGFSVNYVGSFLHGLGRSRSWRQAYLSIEAEQQARIETSDWIRRKSREELADGSDD